jgi:iron complex transport system substrate-binding protein
MDLLSVPTPFAPKRKGSRRPWLVLGALLLLACQAGGAPASTPPTVSSMPPTLPSTPPTASTSAPSGTREAVLPTMRDRSPRPSDVAFPVTLTDDEGTATTLEREPERVIGLSPANTEILFTLGVPEKAVGGTDFDDFPPEAAALPDVATFNGVLIERVVELEPDLVIAAGNAFTPAADIERMRDLDIPVLVVYAETVDEVLADIRLIGSAVGAGEQADALTTAMTSRIDEVRTAAEAQGQRPRVFYQIGSEPEIYGPAPDSFVADMVELAGGAPITTGDPNVFSIPLEQLVEQDPEIVIVGDAQYGVCPETVMERPGWQSMTAVRDGAVRAIDDTIVTRPGPRLAEGLAALAFAIHPDIDMAVPPPPVTACATPSPSATP